MKYILLYLRDIFGANMGKYGIDTFLCILNSEKQC